MFRRGESGFTLMEILVAIFVLAIGLAGIMSVFPAGIKWGNETVKDTYSSILAQSVVDAFKVCLRENRFEDPETGHPYIVFDHDGITDDPTQHRARNPDYSRDYVILLPQYNRLDEKRVFIYPETSSNPNGGGDNRVAENDADRTVEGRDGLPVIEITRTYEAGQAIRRRLEDPDVSKKEKELLAQDPYTQYSYSIEIRRAKIDSDKNGRIDASDLYSNFLFELEVRIYRNFDSAATSKWNQPIHTIVTHVEM